MLRVSRTRFSLNDIPIEILESILFYLPRQSIHECLFVCKSWYSIVVPALYKTIILYSIGKIESFFRTVTSTHLISDQNTMVKHIRFLTSPYNLPTLPQNKEGEHFIHGFYDAAEGRILDSYLEEIFTYCPNLETWTIHDLAHSLHSGHDDLIDHTLSQAYTQEEAAYTKRLNSYAIEYARVDTLFYNESSFHSYGGFFRYLGLFPNLKCLSVVMKDTSVCSVDLFQRIIHTYPALECLYYSPEWTDNHFFDRKEYIPNDSIRKLAVHISSLTKKHIDYISNTFANLRRLEITVTNTTYDSALIIGLLSIRHRLHKMTIRLHDCLHGEIRTALTVINQFLGHAAITEIYIEYDEWKSINGYPRMAFTNDGRTHVVEVYATKPCFRSLFEGVGDLVKCVTIGGFPDPISAEEVNLTFPNITRLTLNNITLDPVKTFVPYLNLTRLALEDVTIDQELINTLYALYPSVAILYIQLENLYPLQQDFLLEEKIYEVYFPWTGFKDMILVGSYTTPACTVFRKEFEKNDEVKLWKHESKTGLLLVAEDASAMDEFLATVPLPIIIISYTLDY